MVQTHSDGTAAIAAQAPVGVLDPPEAMFPSAVRCSLMSVSLIMFGAGA
jgi:hypothetical protein